MADQATVRHGLHAPGPSPGSHSNGVGVVGSLAELGNDVANLIELQALLAEHDLKECVARASRPVLVTLAGLVGGTILAVRPSDELRPCRRRRAGGTRDPASASD